MRRTPSAGLALALSAGAVLGWLGACKHDAPAATASTAELTVFAAASLREAFTDLGKAFEADHPGAHVIFNFAGTQELRTQLEHGAVVDVFASADARHMDALVKAGAVAAPVELVRNEPVVVVARDKAGTIKAFADLGAASRIVIGVPEVPIGRYTQQVIDNASKTAPELGAAITSKIVSKELNVRQVLAKISLGEADAGFVYRTDAVTAGDKVAVVTIPADINVIAHYPIAVTSKPRNAELAKAFVALVTSPVGAAALQKRGFLAP